MATTYYAWSNIKYGVKKDDKGNYLSDLVAPAGSVVSKDKLKLTDDQWNELLESRAVRKDEHPDMPNSWTGSPVEWFREQARRAANNEPQMGAPPEEEVDTEEEPAK